MKLNRLQASEFKKCKGGQEGASYFTRKYLKLRHPDRGTIPFIPYGWQDDLLGHLVAKQNVILKKSRQVGASWIVGAYVIWLITFFTDVEIYLYSDGERKAISLLRKIRFMYRSLPPWLRHEIMEDNKKRLAVAIRKVDKDTGKDYVFSISSIDSYPSSPNAARSESPTFVFFDEHALQDHDAELWEGIIPALQHGGHICSVSTPKSYASVHEKVWEAVTSGLQEGWIPMVVHYTDCGFDEAWVKRNAVGLTPAQIRQEYELEISQGDNPVFSSADLAACYRPLIHPKGPDALYHEWHKYLTIAGGIGSDITKEEFHRRHGELMEIIASTTELYTGVDTSEGKGQDQNSVCTLNEYGVQIACNHNNMTLPQWAGFTKDDGEETPGFVAQWYRKYPGWLTIEENGPGLTVYNRMRHRDTHNMIRMRRAADNLYRTGLKTRIINDLVLAFAGHQIVITDPVTYTQLLAYQRDEKTGRMSAPKGKLDDAVMSLAWAYHTLKQHGIKTFEVAGALVGGSRIFSHAPEDIINVGSLRDIESIGPAPMTDTSEWGINTRWGDFDLERIKSLR